MQASHVGLIPLITPVSALMVGQFFNGEIVSADVWHGTVLILVALSLHQWGDQMIAAIRASLIPVKRTL